MSNTALVTRGPKNQEVETPLDQAMASVISLAESDAMTHLGYMPNDKLTKLEKATVDFFTIQYLMKRGKVTQSAVVRKCLEVFQTQSYQHLDYGTWDQFCDALATSDGTHIIEITEEMASYIRVAVPRLLAVLDAAPIVLPAPDPNDEPEIINAATFLDGKFSTAIELLPPLRHNDPLDPAFRPTFEHWVIEAAHSSRRELRRKMQAAGMKDKHEPDEKIPALRSLESSYVDPTTGEIVDGDVIKVVLYLKSRYADRLYENRLRPYVNEVMLANPQPTSA